MTPREEFVEAMKMQVEKTYQLINCMDGYYSEADDEEKSLKNLRKLAVAFVDAECREHRALFSSGTPPLAKGRIANDHHACRTALLVDCGLEDTP